MSKKETKQDESSIKEQMKNYRDPILVELISDIRSILDEQMKINKLQLENGMFQSKLLMEIVDQITRKHDPIPLSKRPI